MTPDNWFDLGSIMVLYSFFFFYAGVVTRSFASQHPWKTSLYFLGLLIAWSLIALVQLLIRHLLTRRQKRLQEPAKQEPVNQCYHNILIGTELGTFCDDCGHKMKVGDLRRKS